LALLGHRAGILEEMTASSIALQRTARLEAPYAMTDTSGHRLLAPGTRSGALPGLLTLLGFLWFAAVPALGGTGSEADIVDVAAQRHFIGTDEFYVDGQGRLLLCVQTENHQWALWDALRDSLAAPVGQKCEAPSGLQRFNPMVRWPPVEGAIQGVADSSSFSHAASIHSDSGGATNCGPNLASFFTVTYPNGNRESFYMIVRRDRPVSLHLNAWCESAGGQERDYRQSYDVLPVIDSIDLGNGSTLLSGRRDGQTPVLLLVRRLPRSVWSSGDIFVVPQSTLGPLLAAAGSDFDARYEAMRKLLGLHE
jgi:hypothetical protein